MALVPRRENATEGGGIDGALATIKEIGYVQEFTYGGRQSKPQAALRVVFDIDDMEKPWEQHYTLGASSRYEVASDGYSVEGTLNKQSGAYRFFDHLQAAVEADSLDMDTYLGESVEPLEGLRVRLKNVEYQTVGGEDKRAPVIAAIIEEDKKAKGKGGKAAAKSVDPADEAEALIEELLSEKSPIKKGDLPTLLGQAAKKSPNVKAIVQQAFKESWLFSEDRPWDSDRKKGVVKVREDDEE
jgi:hypothetical protein